MASPAAPNLTPDQYRVIFDVLTLNPTAENRPIREEIAAYMDARKAWTDDARRRKLANPY